MKKKYVTPMIAVEHYELTQAIAACNVKIGFLDSKCVLNDPDATGKMKDLARTGTFTVDNCDDPAIGMDDYDEICYHTSTTAAFNS